MSNLVLLTRLGVAAGFGWLFFWNIWLTSEVGELRSKLGHAQARAEDAFDKATSAKSLAEEYHHR